MNQDERKAVVNRMRLLIAVAAVLISLYVLRLRSLPRREETR